MKIPFASQSSWKLVAKIVRYRPKRNWIGWLTRWRTSAFEALVGDDLDAKTGQPLVIVHRRRQVPDRSNAEITQDLRADADFTPLPVTIGLRRFLFADRLDGNPGRSIAQIHQHAAAGLLEMVKHDLHARLAGEEILDDVGLVQARQHVLAVTDAVIDECDMRNLVERGAIGIALQRADGTVGGKGRDPLD